MEMNLFHVSYLERSLSYKRVFWVKFTAYVPRYNSVFTKDLEKNLVVFYCAYLIHTAKAYCTIHALQFC